MNPKAMASDGTHIYLSTACLHLEHDYCNGKTGHSGPKNPATCKWCPAQCVCMCHIKESE